MTTFTANDGVASNATSYTRRWLLNGTAIGTGTTVVPGAAGTLSLEVTAHGPGGDTVAPIVSVTVAAAAATLSTLTLGTLAATAGSAWSSAISGKTSGSTIQATSSDGTTLTIASGSVSGTFPAAGTKTVTLVETLAGATGSPKTSTITVTVAAAAPSLPKQSAIVDSFHADSIAPQTDNTGVASWTGAKGVLALSQATAARQPKYRTNVANGKPALQVDSTNGQSMIFGSTSDTLAAALDASQAAIGFVIHATGTTGDGYMLTTGVNDGFMNIQAANGRAGSGTYQPTGITGFHTVLITKVPSSGDVPARGRVYINGLPTGITGNFGGSLVGHMLRLFGVDGNGQGYIFGTDCTLSDAVFWTGADMLAPDAVDFHKWAANKYAKALPWAGLSYMPILASDSIWVGGGYGQNLYYQLKAALGFSHGQAAIIGVPSMNLTGMREQLNQELEPMAAKLGIPYRLILQAEWANSFGNAPANSQVATFTGIIADRQTARGSGSKVIVIGPTATAGDQNNDGTTSNTGAGRVDYQTRVKVLSGIDNFQDIANDNYIGAIGAAPPVANTTYPTANFDDDRHLTNAGIGRLVPYVQAGLAAVA